MSQSLKNLVKAGVITATFAQSITAFANPVAKDLESCAIAALAERQQSASMITVKTGGLTRSDLDRDSSVKRHKYKMLLTKKSSGERLGIVTCSLNQDGQLITATFNG